MDDALAKLGVTEMGKEGDAFDPALHNAVSHVEDEKAGENTVVKVFQKGYRIGDRIVRHAMVQVAN
jgi:molecular chaperone GrpE